MQTPFHLKKPIFFDTLWEVVNQAKWFSAYFLQKISPTKQAIVSIARTIHRHENGNHMTSNTSFSCS